MPFDFDTPIDRRGTASLKWDFCERVHGVSGVIPMWVADMDLAAPPVVVKALRARAAHPVYGYPMVPASFWQAAAGWFKRRQGWDVNPSWMTLAPGVVPALNLCVEAFTRPGDKIVIQTPVYHPFYSAIELNGRRIVRNPLRWDGRRFVMDLEGGEAWRDPRTRMLILCSPHNPVGRVWTREELIALEAACAARDLVVIADEIHGDLILPGHAFTPYATISPAAAARTVTLAAPSKTFNVAGLGTALAIASEARLKDLFDARIQSAGLNVNSVFGLAACEAAYAGGDAWLDALLSYLDGNAAFAERFAADRLPRLGFIRPEGTYLGLLDCRALGLSQMELNDLFLKTARVYFDPGTKFGEELRGFQRINIGCPRAQLREALERVAGAVAGRSRP
jgi:cystathionine beta-lyase